MNKSLYVEKSNIDLKEQFFKKDKDITMMMWFKITDGTEGRTLISQILQRSGDERISLGVMDNKIFYYTGANGTSLTQTVENDKWYHIAYVYKNNILTGYLNGDVDFNLPITQFQNDNTCLFSYSNGGSDFFNGFVDEFKIYNYALSQQEVKNKMIFIEKDFSHVLRYYDFNTILQDNILIDKSNHKNVVIENFVKLSNDIPSIYRENYLLKKDNDYYSMSNNLLKLGQPLDNNELNNWYDTYGIKDLNDLLQNNKIEEIERQLGNKIQFASLEMNS